MQGREYKNSRLFLMGGLAMPNEITLLKLAKSLPLLLTLARLKT